MIGGFEPFTLIDYPVVPAATIFFVGCPWRCWYCHNKDVVLGRISKEISWDEIINYLKIRSAFLKGVVLSGGEPLMTDIEWYVEELKRLGYKVKIDTNGAYPDRLEKLLSKNIVDYISMDIKAPLHLYSTIIGCSWSIESIKKSIDVIKKSNLPYQFRTTYDPSMQFTIDTIEQYIGESITVQPCNTHNIGLW